jgi:polyisoprenoid-binding protein YceI
MRGRVRSCLLALIAPGLLAAATPRDFALEPGQSQIEFQLRALGWWPVRGGARAEGRVALDDEHADIEVEVPLASLKMAREGYRDWALSDEFFDAARHPRLRFSANAVPVKALHEGGSIEGELSVRGISRRVRFTLAAGDCTRAAERCRVQAEGVLSRRAFGMRSRRYTLGDAIRVRLDLHLQAAP